MQPEFSTPMMKQYLEIKKQYEDCLLFYRMGDFYELFMEDADIGARVLNITLTSRARGKDGRIPMAGIPYHAVDSYLSKLVKAGYKVAVCEQVSLPNKSGLIDREVIRIVTPGTVLDEKALDKKENNYIISIFTDNTAFSITVADISTGYFSTIEVQTNNLEQTIQDELARIHPAECILPEGLYNNPDILRILKTEKNLNIFPFFEWETYANDAKTVLKKHFGVSTLESFGIQDKPLVLQTSAALLGYLQQTQKGPVNHIKKIISVPTDDYLVLDKSTILNLELFSTIREHDTKGTLLYVLDQTLTAMGGRMLKQWIKKPLSNQTEIERRHDAVEILIHTVQIKESLCNNIKEVSDIERIFSRVSVGLGNARDLINLKNSLRSVLEVKELLLAVIPSGAIAELRNLIPPKQLGISPRAQQLYMASLGRDDKKNESTIFVELSKSISPQLNSLISLIEKNIVEEPPISLREGKIFKSGVNKELDQLRKVVGGSREWVLELERQERERTGIASLKVRFNQVFGFYIEISKSNLHLVPENYMRKQTLVNGERFITSDLKKQEEIILSSEEKINDLEYRLFQELLEKILAQVEIIQSAAQSIATLDCLLNFAYLAEKNNYVRPLLANSGELHIKNGRHPVVEKLLEDTQFVPNDVTFDNHSQQLLLITGPNMAGKSVFIRQVALIVLMAQIGSFVSAEEAEISVVDRIFVRSGASDVITSGLSTFMVEMVETAHILHQATKNSLIVMDEIGRGTSTYDGISIAWAVAEYLVRHINPSPKTLFATHYHELQVLEEQYPNQIKNFHMSVADDKGEPIFFHTILSGGASHSFGVAVAKLAGIPEEVIVRANELLADLENRGAVSTLASSSAPSKEREITPFNLAHHLIQKELESIDLHQMTPLEALNKLADLKNKLKLLELEKKEMLQLD